MDGLYWGWSISDGYGYQWWIDDSGVFSAVGHGGQYIMVVPGKNMAVVFTSVLKDTDFAVPGRLLKEYIIPSVSSDKSLPPNMTELNRLKSITKEKDESPQLENVLSLPEMAKEISGRIYKYDANRLGLESICLTFQPNKKVATARLRSKRSDVVAEIDLDNVFRVTKTKNVQIALKGRWIGNRTFLLSYSYIGDTGRGDVTIGFENNNLRYSIHDLIMGEIELTARVE